MVSLSLASVASAELVELKGAAVQFTVEDAANLNFSENFDRYKSNINN